MSEEVAVESAEVIRAGTAVAARLKGGALRVVRRIDLAPLLGEPEPDEPRFETARATGAGVKVTLAGNLAETLPADCFADAARRCVEEARAELVVEGAGLLVTCDGDSGDPLGLIQDGALLAGGGKILWVGPRAALPQAGFDTRGALRTDAGGRLVTPGLIDCHAHPLFAGNRADEFARRAAGENYLDIAATGGGIAATVGPTRAASFEDHVRLCGARMARALCAGTTTCEAKSGYDGTADGELRLLKIAWAVDGLSRMDIWPTLLGAHFLPPERKHDRAGFVDEVAEKMVPAAAERRLCRAVDVYCDEGAFTLEEARRVLTAARGAGLAVRAHVGQFSDLGAAELVAELGGLSIDHVENISERGMRASANAGVVAVMLPGACVQLGMQPPPVAALREAGVALAVATDLNPGTSLCETLPVQMWLASTHYGMTVEETWLGVTRVAARALGRHDIGVLTPGAAADLAVWDVETPAEICYRYGGNLVHQVVKAGRPIPSFPASAETP